MSIAVIGASTLTSADVERKLAKLVNGVLGDAMTKQNYRHNNTVGLDVLWG